MKLKSVPPLLVFVLIAAASMAQESPDPVPAQELTQLKNVPIYILSVNDKAMELKMDKNTKSDLAHISPGWIKTISVLKSKDAIEEYGAKGVHGVVVIQLKKDKFNQLPPSIKDQLR
jgi:hypothetical protein